MKKYEIEGLIFSLTNEQEEKFQILFPKESRTSNEEIRDSARKWVIENGTREQEVEKDIENELIDRIRKNG